MTSRPNGTLTALTTKTDIDNLYAFVNNLASAVTELTKVISDITRLSQSELVLLKERVSIIERTMQSNELRKS